MQSRCTVHRSQQGLAVNFRPPRTAIPFSISDVAEKSADLQIGLVWSPHTRLISSEGDCGDPVRT